MSNQNLKSDILQLVEDVEDTNVLESVRFLLIRFVPEEKKQKIVAYTVDGKPLTQTQFEQSIVTASEKVKTGQFVKHSDVVKKVAEWKQKSTN
jgi:peptide subunit release factor 1 (eRF1)